MMPPAASHATGFVRLRPRLAWALGLATLAVVVFLAHTQWGPAYVRGKAGDLAGPLEGARRMLAGQRDIYADPYAPYATRYALSYPLTASVFVLPLAPLPPRVAAALFVAVGTGLAAFMLSGRRREDLWLFASSPAFFAWAWAQWSPWMLIQGLGAWTMVLGLCKPQVGAVMFAWRPHVRGLVPAAIVLAATLAWSPSWPLDWLRGALRTAGEVDEHAGALFAPGGFLLLAAAWRWRDPRARLLLALAIVPNRLWFYDQLFLGFIPQTRTRMFVWIAGTWLAAAGWWLARRVTGDEARFALEALLIAFVYGPALYCVLRPVPVPTPAPLPAPASSR